MAITVQQLFKQIQQQDFAAVKRAFGLNPSLVHSKHPKDAHTPLHAAAALGNVQLLKELLQLGASCHEVDCNNEAPLHVAARQGHTAIVKELLTDAGRRSCLKAANRDGATPLHLAVLAGHADVAQALINAGARTDMRDRAGRTPTDLVNPTDIELADILSQGRQLTPSSGNRSVRRTISPAMSPPPGRGSRGSNRGVRSGPVSPTGEVEDAQGQDGDHRRRGSSTTGTNASSKQPSRRGSLSPSRAADKAAAKLANVHTPAAAATADTALELVSSSMQAGYDLCLHPDHNEGYDQHGRLLPKADVTSAAEAGQQQHEHAQQQQQVQPATTNQAWLQYSPQKSLDGVFAQVQQPSEPAEEEQQLTPYYEAYQQPSQRNSRPDNAAPEAGNKLQHPAGISADPTTGQHNMAPGVIGSPAANHSTVGPGALGLQYQQRQQQVQQQQQPAQLGPLHRARAAGPMAAGVAAAAAVNDLTRSFDHHPALILSATPAVHNSRQLAQQHSGMSSMKQQPSSVGAGASYIVSPEASSGLLQAQVNHPPVVHHYSSVPHAQASSAGVQSHCAEYSLSQHAVEHSGPLSAGASTMHGQCSRRSLSVIPGSGPNTPHQPGSHTLPPAPPNLAALAAAVAANSRVGPLSQPLQLQLNDLAGKVSQLEAWFEAQVELIPEWQKVLAVVQGLKRQLEEQGDKLNSQQLTALNWAAQVTAVEKAQHAQADTLASVPRQAMEIAELRAEQAVIKASMAEFGQQISQLQAQLVHQAATEAARNAADECQLRSLQAVLSANAARLATIEESQLASLTTGLTANSSRLATLEAGMENIRARLREQHSTAKEAAATAAAAIACAESASRANSKTNSKSSSPEPDDTDAAAADARMLALESSLADLQLTVAELHSANVAAAQQEQTGGEPANTAKPNDTPATVADDAINACSRPSSMDLEAELNELKARVADLSASMYSMGSMAPLQGGAVEDTFLPFMETTSNCLQQHEQQLDAIQTLVPKLESVVAQRAQMCELIQQVAALQTAFNLLTGAKPAGTKDTPTRPSPGMLASGPLAANKAAADYLAMATNMVKLQTQMGALSAAVEQLQQDWDSTSATLKTEHEAIRSAWESERSRLAAAEREAVRRVVDQQRELKQREERLTQIREAALAEEAARRNQLDSEERVSAALEGITCQHEQFKGQLAGLADATEALREHLASLQAEVVSSLVNLGPHIAAMTEQKEEQEPTAEDAAVVSVPQCNINVMSSLDNTNPVYEPEAEGTPRATAGLSSAANPFAFSPARPAVASPRQAGSAAGSQRTSPHAITWQQQQQTGDIRTSTALAYAEVTGGVCTVNLLPVPPADAAPSGSVSSLPTAVTSTPPPAAAAAASAKKGSWLARHLGSYKTHSGASHRYEQQRDDADVAPLDQVAAEAEHEGAAPDSDAPAGPGSSGRALDQSPVRAAAASSKQAGKWKTPWKKLGFGHKTSSSGTA